LALLWDIELGRDSPNRMDCPKMRMKTKQEDEIPETLQGIKLYRAYAINQIDQNNLNNKRLERLIVICDQRIEAKEKGAEYGRHTETQDIH